MKKLALGALVPVSALSASVWLASDRILQHVMKSSLLTIATRFQTGLLSDGALHVWFCGTGSPQAERDRAQSCTAILAGGSFLVFDTDAGSGLKADLGNLPLANLEAVFSTHLHSDHITDLPVFMNHSWRYGRQQLLNVIGPAGTAEVVAGFNQALGPDIAFCSQNEVAQSAPIEVGQSQAVMIPNSAPSSDGRSLRTYGNLAFAVGHDVGVEGAERTLVYESLASKTRFRILHTPGRCSGSRI
jgi:ribonuclease Z